MHHIIISSYNLPQKIGNIFETITKETFYYVQLL